MKQLGEDISEQLEYVPASFRVIRHLRPKLTCTCCDHITQVAAPSRPIERGLAGPGLLAHVLVSKFAERGVIDGPHTIRLARQTAAPPSRALCRDASIKGGGGPSEGVTLVPLPERQF